MRQQPPSTRQVALGVFIVGQLFFLISANFLGLGQEARPEMVPNVRRAVEAVAPGWAKERGPFWYLTDQLARADTMWAQVTGQLQSWSLFAPAVSRDCVFPALEIYWGKAPVADAPGSPQLFLSENEPVDLDEYFRVGNFRLRRFENNFTLALGPDDRETTEQTKKRLRAKIRDHVADYEPILLGYMRWRVKNVLARWPGRGQPRQVILVLRRYHIADREDAPPYWQGPFVMPLARWQSDRTGEGALEWFDPIDGRFKMLDHE